MKKVIIILWLIVLFIFTCASNARFWSYGDVPTFRWVADPNFSEILNFKPNITPEFIVRKMGHFLGFTVLAVLFHNRKKNAIISIVASIVFALLTELFQLYFGRDGRLYDVIIDSCGIVFGIMAIKILRKYQCKINN